jgi:hypothetical protein
MGAVQIAALVRSDENQVRRVIHEFTALGFESLRLAWGRAAPQGEPGDR